MRRLNDFRCESCDQVEERFEYDDVKIASCNICGGTTHKIVSGTNFKLPGYDPAYPTAWDKWAKNREPKR